MSYSGRWDQMTGPIIPVRLERVEDRTRVVNVKGLVDTGATLSLISADVAVTLGLAPLRFKAVATANGTVELPFHVVRIVLRTETVPLRPRGVLESLPDGFGGRRMLVGRDILKNGTLVMGPEKFQLTIHPPN